MFTDYGSSMEEPMAD